MIYTLIIVLIVALDRYSKLLAVEYLKGIETYPLIKDIFHLTYRENTGAAFSILSEHTKLLAALSVTMAFGLIVYVFWLKKRERFTLAHLGLLFIIGGAIGNGIDRIVYGYVVDYFDFTLINFAVFNVADSFVNVGVALYAIDLIFFEAKRNKKQAEPVNSKE